MRAICKAIVFVVLTSSQGWATDIDIDLVADINQDTPTVKSWSYTAPPIAAGQNSWDFKFSSSLVFTDLIKIFVTHPVDPTSSWFPITFQFLDQLGNPTSAVLSSQFGFANTHHRLDIAPPISLTAHQLRINFTTSQVPTEGLGQHSLAFTTLNPGGMQIGQEDGDSEVQVDLDIKPGSDSNSINLKSKGLVPVAILGSSIDVSSIDVSSLEFGPNGASPVHDGHLEDVDGDGETDLVVHFRTQDIGFDEDSEEGILTGKTNDDVDLEGSDSVRIAPGSKKGKAGKPAAAAVTSWGEIKTQQQE